MRFVAAHHRHGVAADERARLVRRAGLLRGLGARLTGVAELRRPDGAQSQHGVAGALDEAIERAVIEADVSEEGRASAERREQLEHPHGVVRALQIEARW